MLKSFKRSLFNRKKKLSIHSLSSSSNPAVNEPLEPLELEVEPTTIATYEFSSWETTGGCGEFDDAVGLVDKSGSEESGTMDFDLQVQMREGDGHEIQEIENEVTSEEDEVEVGEDEGEDEVEKLVKGEEVTLEKEVERRVRKVLVLLDGDGDTFHQEYLSQGFKGGSKAALSIVKQVKEFIVQKDGLKNSNEVDVFVASFLNSTGFYQFRKAQGQEVDIRAFARGFSSSAFTTSMIDTGYEKQSADDAIKSYIQFHLSLVDYILLGGTHDGGYAKTLHRLDQETLKKKIVLLLTCSEKMVASLEELGCEKAKFGKGLFERKDHFERGRVGGGGGGGMMRGRTGDSKLVLVTETSKELEVNSSFVAGDSYAKVASTSSHTSPIFSSSISAGPSFASTTLNPSNPFHLLDDTSSASFGFSSPHLLPLLPLPVPSPPPSPPRLPSKFYPLIRILQDQKSLGHSHPLRSHIGGLLPHGVYASFKEYVAEAESLGVVTLGSERNVIGKEWISLNPKYSLTPRTSISPPSSPPPSPTRPLPPPAFIPLVNVLRTYSSSDQPPICSIIAERLKKLDSGLYPRAGDGIKSFKQYVMKAERLKIVKTGGVDAVDFGAKWIVLERRYL